MSDHVNVIRCIRGALDVSGASLQI